MSVNFNKKTINCNGKLLDISNPLVMGIVNITPDSFYNNSIYNSEKEILTRVENILEEGGQIIDLGAYSSRPGAAHISEDEEYTRLSKALEVIKKKFSNLIISIDTFRAGIAKKTFQNFEISMINDISAGELDGKMFEIIAEINIPYVIMHMKGTPQNMQINPKYENIFKEIVKYFAEKIEKLTYLGVKDIILDPGFGFGKTIEDNYKLVNYLDRFSIFNLPLLVGFSRKSMIYKYLKINPEDALTGTTALNIVALQKGVNILRVHDVKEAVETVKIFNKLKENSNVVS